MNEKLYIEKRPKAVKELILFFAITFGIMYGLGGVFTFYKSDIERIFGPIKGNGHPLIQLLVYGPTIAGLIITIIFHGIQGVAGLFTRTVARTRIIWWVIGIMMMPAIITAFGVFTGIGDWPFVWSNYFKALQAICFGTWLFADPGALGEELGWRGFALPRLLNLFSPLKATIILTVIWIIFHAVAFIAPGSNQHGTSILWFTVMVFGLGFIITWLYINTAGNWLLAGFFLHYVFNSFALSGVFKIGPGIAITVSVSAVILYIIKRLPVIEIVEKNDNKFSPL